MPDPDSRVVLVPVDAAVLDELIEVATTDTDPDDVTPPLGDGWTPERVAWLRAYHQQRRSGLAGGDEETRAIRFDGRIVGATRLHRVDREDPSELEFGIWLAKSVRGLGLGGVVLRVAAERATRAGATRLTARTTQSNSAALRLLQRANATLEWGPDQAVSATLALQHCSSPKAG